jgi:small-conductance mechanosensitive channel
MYPSLLRFGVGDARWLDPAIAASIFALSLLLALGFNKLLLPLILRLARWTPTDLDNRIVRAIRLPLSIGIVVLGAYLALTVALDLSQGQQRAVDTIGRLLGIVLGVAGVAGVVSSVFSWYVATLASRTRHGFDDRLIPLVRRVSVVLIYGLGALLVLDQLSINITPLVAGLGLGGLAVALALQPTLANLFAGTYVMTEGVVAPGDYIELENGAGGQVIDVGWRSTRIRTRQNNLLVVPNSRFAETIITNYEQPEPAVNVILTCGISYDSDLEQVERVCQEVMDEVVSTNPNAVKDSRGQFGYDSFGDSNVNFWLFVQARDREASFDLKTALMQKLHRRFQQEGIVINYPVRALQFPPDWSTGAVARRRVGITAHRAADPGGKEAGGNERP